MNFWESGKTTRKVNSYKQSVINGKTMFYYITITRLACTNYLTVYCKL